ncbi:MAG: asparagine synthase (glutamine-hydrolyzing), partial [Planctomycetota bacterium]
MCGIAGTISTGQPANSGEHDPGRDVSAMIDRLAHRGPDGRGIWSAHGAAIGHARLAILDPTPAGAQPMTTEDGGLVLSYNGELYNDAEVRRELSEAGVRFVSACDTETVLRAFEQWGPAALDRFRGMFALALWNASQRTLLLARDPLGIKPLHYAQIGPRAFAFASEPPALFAHPHVSAAPDWESVGAYLRTCCTSWDDRTMFAGVRSLPPGCWLNVDASANELSLTSGVHACAAQPATDADPVSIVRESVLLHARSDVPLCSLLSGGIDSTLIAAIAAQRDPALRTFCAGAKVAAGSDDFRFAAIAAEAIGSTHTEVDITTELFVERVGALIRHNGVPLATPNEVAINEVARRLRRDGYVVALSGEGADELLGGYDLVLENAAAWVDATPVSADGGAFALESTGWLSGPAMETLLRPELHAHVEGERGLD